MLYLARAPHRSRGSDPFLVTEARISAFGLIGAALKHDERGCARRMCRGEQRRCRQRAERGEERRFTTSEIV
jgi:hypothetical protein